MKQPPFKLYPEEKHWWSFQDYSAVLTIMERLHPARVLEFGPGNSTLALIEGGAAHIDCCEDNPIWFNTYKERIADAYPAIVRFVPYEWSDPVSIPAIDAERYDLALIDGPHGTLNRPAVIAYCLQRCAAVLVPTEEIAYGKGALRPHIQRLGDAFGFDIEWMETGPLSGGFALLTSNKSLLTSNESLPAQAAEVSIDTAPQVEQAQHIEGSTSGFAHSNEVGKPEVSRRRGRRRKGGGA